jgi:hypothetical protein
MPSIKLSKDAKWEQAKLDQYTLEKMQKNPGVYTGTTLKTHGFNAIGE